MMTKTKIALSALLVAGFASTVFANDVPEGKIGDRYPALEHTAQQPTGVAAYAAVRRPTLPFTAAERALFARAKGIW